MSSDLSHYPGVFLIALVAIVAIVGLSVVGLVVRLFANRRELRFRTDDPTQIGKNSQSDNDESS